MTFIRSFFFMALLTLAQTGEALAMVYQPFIKTSFLNLKEDLAEAKQAKRGLMVIYEQEGCPYCAQMHKVNFSDRETIDLITKNFDVVQMDTLGSRMVVDLDGKAMTEKQLAEKLRVQYVPLVGFFGPDGKEVFRLPGYFQQPDMFRAGLTYVIEKQYDKVPFSEYAAKRAPQTLTKGLIDEPFFSREDDFGTLLARAAKSNKGVALVFEQAVCAGCAELHEKKFRNAALSKALTNQFEVARLDIWGKRAIKDFRNQASSDSLLAKSLNIRYTPTIVFFDRRGTEILRLESYLTPEHFGDLITYATTDARKRYASFQEYLGYLGQR